MEDFKKIESFYNFLKENPKYLDYLKAEIKNHSAESFLKEIIIPFAKNYSFNLNFENFLDYEKHLRSSARETDDKLLENVAGGVKIQDVGKGLALFALLGGISLGLTETTSFAASPLGKNVTTNTSQKENSIQEPKILSCTNNKIVLETSPDYEYNIMKDELYTTIPWQRPFQDSGIFEDLEDFTEYKINVRNKETLQYLSKPITVKTKISSEKIKVCSCTFDYIYITSSEKSCEYSITCTDKTKESAWSQQGPFQSSGEFNNLNADTTYKINVRDVKTKQLVSEPIIVKTKKSPYDTKTISVSDNQIVIESIQGYTYYLMESEHSHNLGTRAGSSHQKSSTNGVFSDLKSNTTYVLGVSYGKRRPKDFYTCYQNIRAIKTASALTETQKSTEKELHKTNPEKPKILSVSHGEIIMEDLPPGFVYKLQNFELDTVTQSSGIFKNLKSDKEYWITVLSKDRISNGRQAVCCDPILIKTKENHESKEEVKTRRKVPMLLYTTYDKIVLETLPGYEYKLSRTINAIRKNDKNNNERYTYTYEVPWQNSGVLDVSGDPCNDDTTLSLSRYYKVQIRDTKTGLIVDSINVTISDESQKPKIELLGCTHNRVWVKTLPDCEYRITPKNNINYDPAKVQNHGAFENLNSNTEYNITVYKKGDKTNTCIGAVNVKTKEEPGTAQ